MSSFPILEQPTSSSPSGSSSSAYIRRIPVPSYSPQLPPGEKQQQPSPPRKKSPSTQHIQLQQQQQQQYFIVPAAPLLSVAAPLTPPRSPNGINDRLVQAASPPHHQPPAVVSSRPRTISQNTITRSSSAQSGLAERSSTDVSTPSAIRAHSQAILNPSKLTSQSRNKTPQLSHVQPSTSLRDMFDLPSAGQSMARSRMGSIPAMERQLSEKLSISDDGSASGSNDEKKGHKRNKQSSVSYPPVAAPPQPVSWDLSHELDYLESPSLQMNRIPENRTGKKFDTLEEPFSTFGQPNNQRLWEAGRCELINEWGKKIKFGSLFEKRKTCVFFIRHFWCGQCQDYMQASIPELDPIKLEEAGIDVIIISNGHWQIIKKYREIFKCPFPIFVDGPRRLYNLMGMTRLNNDFGSLKQADRARYNVRTVPGQLVHGIGNGLFKMPIRDPGKLTQLGGEFVIGPGLQSHFAHRMENTSDHWEAVDVVLRAGLDIRPWTLAAQNAPKTPLECVFTPGLDPAWVDEGDEADPIQTNVQEIDPAEEDDWEKSWESRRELELARMRKLKEERRRGRFSRGAANTTVHPSVPEEQPFDNRDISEHSDNQYDDAESEEDEGHISDGQAPQDRGFFDDAEAFGARTDLEVTNLRTTGYAESDVAYTEAASEDEEDEEAYAGDEGHFKRAYGTEDELMAISSPEVGLNGVGVLGKFQGGLSASIHHVGTAK